MTLREFTTIYNEWKYRDRTVPEHARKLTKFSEGSANDLTKAVLAWFEWKGIKAYRQASEGRYIPEKRITNVLGQSIIAEKGKFIPRSKGAKGSADISAVIPPHGKRMEVEIKYGKDRQSDDQKKFQSEIEAMGGIYFIVKTWDGFIFEIKKYVK